MLIIHNAPRGFAINIVKFGKMLSAAMTMLLLAPDLPTAETALTFRGPVERQQTIDGRYQYSTGKVSMANNNEKKLWDYLDFFTWSSDSDEKNKLPAEESTELRARVRELTRQLVENSMENFIGEYTLVVSSFVNLNNLYKTSTFGRYLGEQMIGELQLAGAEVIDVRKSAGLMVHERLGEYAISRQMKELSYVHAAQVTIVGTYTKTRDQIFINAKALRNSDGLVLSNGSMVFGLDDMTRQMLSDEAMPARRNSLVKVEGIANK